MSAKSRRKGANAERELISMLRDRLGELDGLKRNLNQYRASGDDFSCGPFSVECKRTERFLTSYLHQAEENAGERIPVVAWRSNGQKWRFLPILDIEQFCELVRERL